MKIRKKNNRSLLLGAFPVVAAILLLTSCTSFQVRKPFLYPLPEDITFAGEHVPLGYADAEERISNWYNFFLTKPWEIRLWFERAGTIFPFIEEKLEERGMPLDLKYVAVAESYLNPRAISAAGAAGIWQLTQNTAKAFGLHINTFVDERYDYVLATDAALEYFERAREEIGDSWFLVCASFNLGIRGVKERMERQRSSDYWAMVFPPETEDYLPKIIAIKLIMENSGQLGFKTKEASAAVRTLTLQTEEKPIYLSDIAKKTSLTFREIWLLNPHICKPYLPPGGYRLYLPVESGMEAKRLNDYLNSLPYKKEAYIVKEGESPASIAEKLGMSEDELMSFNNVESSREIKEGDELIYWKKAVTP